MKENTECKTVCVVEDTGVAIERTPEFFQVAQQLSEYIHSLPLDQPANDQLVALMVDQVQQAERDAFAYGFRMGVEFERYEQHSDIPRRAIYKLPIS